MGNDWFGRFAQKSFIEKVMFLALAVLIAVTVAQAVICPIIRASSEVTGALSAPAKK